MKPETYHAAMMMEKIMMMILPGSGVTFIENVDKLMMLDITAVTGWCSY